MRADPKDRIGVKDRFSRGSFVSPVEQVMHPQLSDKKFVCRDFIEALERCHASGFNRLTGACNTKKDQLNQCLRTERVARTTANRETAKGRNKKADDALKEFRALEA